MTMHGVIPVLAIIVIGGVVAGVTMRPEADVAAQPTHAAAPPTEARPPNGAAPSAADVAGAVERGLAYLALTQDRRTGGWNQDVGFKFNDRYEITVANRPHVGVSALALMAFLAGGHVPGRGQYGDVVARGTDFILEAVDTDTGFISANETRMYSHAFACLYLAEIFGMTHRSDVQRKLQQAIDLTVETQNKQGSWRYRPYAPDSDMSIGVCQLMALRAARNIGIHVPRQTIERAYDYIRKSAYPRRHRSYGAFKYQIDQVQTRTSFALAAAGVASLLHAGYYEDDMIQPGIDWLRRHLQRGLRNQERYPTYFYWYGHYYCAQVMFIASDKDPKLWDEFYWPLISRDLLERQKPSGAWENNPGPGDVYGTAVACIMLQIPYEFLPIFQR